MRGWSGGRRRRKRGCSYHCEDEVREGSVQSNHSELTSKTTQATIAVGPSSLIVNRYCTLLFKWILCNVGSLSTSPRMY